MANAFLTPNNMLDAIPELANEDYIEAQTVGRTYGNCTQYYDACPFSIFQVSVPDQRPKVTTVRILETLEKGSDHF